MTELLPVGFGLLLGLGVGLCWPTAGWLRTSILTVALGVAATVVTGEFRVSWGFVLVDIPLVAVAALTGLFATRRLRKVARA
jgi:hypothetical protein